jgi:hypothetical protein
VIRAFSKAANAGRLLGNNFTAGTIVRDGQILTRDQNQILQKAME